MEAHAKFVSQFGCDTTAKWQHAGPGKHDAEEVACWRVGEGIPRSFLQRELGKASTRRKAEAFCARLCTMSREEALEWRISWKVRNLQHKGHSTDAETKSSRQEARETPLPQKNSRQLWRRNGLQVNATPTIYSQIKLVSLPTKGSGCGGASKRFQVQKTEGQEVKSSAAIAPRPCHLEQRT